MKKDYEEIYANDKKDLLGLIQDWIDENVEQISCSIIDTELRYNK